MKKVPTFWFQRGGRTRFAEHLVRNQGRHTRAFLGPYIPLPAPTHDWSWARLKEVAEAHPDNWLSADCLYSSQDLLPIGMDRIIHDNEAKSGGDRPGVHLIRVMQSYGFTDNKDPQFYFAAMCGFYDVALEYANSLLVVKGDKRVQNWGTDRMWRVMFGQLPIKRSVITGIQRTQLETGMPKADSGSEMLTEGDFSELDTEDPEEKAPEPKKKKPTWTRGITPADL